MDEFYLYIFILIIATISITLHILETVTFFRYEITSSKIIEVNALKIGCILSFFTFVGLLLSWSMMIGTMPALGLIDFMPDSILKFASHCRWPATIIGIIGIYQLGFWIIATIRSYNRKVLRSYAWGCVASLTTCATLAAWYGMF